MRRKKAKLTADCNCRRRVTVLVNHWTSKYAEIRKTATETPTLESGERGTGMDQKLRLTCIDLGSPVPTGTLGDE